MATVRAGLQVQAVIQIGSGSEENKGIECENWSCQDKMNTDCR